MAWSFGDGLLRQERADDRAVWDFRRTEGWAGLRGWDVGLTVRKRVNVYALWFGAQGVR